MEGWCLELLGTARLSGPSGKLVVERKPAALLAYLALEGPTSRSKLAYLFWPDSREEAARVNLRQLLHRVRLLRELPLIKGEDPLQLDDDLEVDVVYLLRASLGDDRTILTASGELLAHYTYDNAPPFAEWLTAVREHLLSLRRQTLTAHLEQLEAEGTFHEARGCAERLLQLDPLSEEAHRRLMRLHYLSGDRSAALTAYHRLQEVLRAQFGLEPLPETVQLAREIALGAPAYLPPVRPKKPLPLSVLRPPVLVGREREWALMEAAWETGTLIFLSGEAGVGKTRLMLDFAASKGPYTLVAARPGDREVPYATHARCVRQFLGAEPTMLHDLEPWVVHELARIVPELGDPPPPMASEEDKLRHLEAQTLFMARCFRGVASNVCDDMQFFDRASFEAGTYAGTASPNSPFRPGTLRSINAFRPSELPPDIEVLIERLIAAGVAVRIKVGPLEGVAVERFVESLELAPALAPALSRYTGGNPLFIVETLKSLLETGGLGTSGDPPLPDKPAALIWQRLQRLSAGALRLAWTAAVAGADFNLELAGHLLERGAIELLGPCEELERAGFFDGQRFSHDLLFEATLTSIPAPARILLHQRCADYLISRQSDAARVAQHLLAAGDDLTAAPYLVRAAESAQAASLWVEAKNLYRRAAAIYVLHGESEKLAITLLSLNRLSAL